jgi:hypothetical protein
MARAAQRDQEERTVEVNRLQLLQTLQENKQKHVKDYQEALVGYKASLLQQIESAFESAKQTVQSRYEKMKSSAEALSSEDDILKQNDYIIFVDRVCIEMKVPKSYEKEYEAAIDIAYWDVRDTLELTNAEFTCFVRDKWDWKSDFDTVTKMYSK